MTAEEFLSQPDLPSDYSEALQALWHAHRGDWEKAHNVAQDISGTEGSWVHACLHREEGDLSNARYWYTRAGKTVSSLPLNEERIEMVTLLLED